MKKIAPEYVFSEEQLNTVKKLSAECGLMEDTVKILYGRGIDDALKISHFIHPSRAHFISPFKMQGMEETVSLITRARDEGWTVVVYGDYDADGVCASTIMSRCLRDFGIDPVVYIPERREGYGLNTGAIDSIFDEWFPQLFITVDCGISCAEEVDYIKEQGAEVIVTDHHELPDNIPDCICVNPKFHDGYIYDNLCGAGVALKVGVALIGEKAYDYLDFAAIATVADSVPLTGENRDIVYEGLKLINAKPRKCYSLFLQKNSGAVNSQTIAFTIAPRINAAGRMGDARAALNLFGETDEKVIFDLAAKLTEYNQERQVCCDELYMRAKSKLKERGAYGKVIMLSDDKWNTGFVGIVAARLADEYSRPSMLFVRNGDMLKGSARSVENVNIFEALKACSEYIEEFGGHAQAAGINIKAENFDKLEKALNEYLSERYSSEDFEPTIYINGALKERCSERFAHELEMLEPFGVGNRRPMFVLDECALEAHPVKPSSPHISVKSEKIDLMYFGGSGYLRLMESRAPKKYVFEYNISNFRGKEYVKGFIRDIICEKDAGGYIGDELAVNNVLTLACPEKKCNKIYKTSGEIDLLLAESGDYGTVCIAHEYSTVKRYKNVAGFPVNLFGLSSSNPVNCVLLAPSADVDLSAFRQIVYLDEPLGVRLASLKDRNVVICSDIAGNNFIEGLPKTRGELLDIFAQAAYNAPNVTAENSGSAALKNNWTYSPEIIAYALEIFRQLGLISYENGTLNIHRGVRTELTKSQLYNTVLNNG